MNLLDVKRLTVEMSGRADLVTDETTYGDAGIMEYINAGQRFIESYRTLPYMASMSVQPVSIGQWAVHDPYVKTIKEVWVVLNDSSRIKLQRHFAGDLYSRQKYAVMTTGTPGYYQIESSRIAHDEILNDVSLLNSATTWNVGTGWTVANGWATHSAGVQVFEQSYAKLAGRIIPSSKYLLSFTLKGQPLALSDAITPKLSGTAGTVRTIDGTYHEVITAGAETPHLLFLPADTFQGSIGEFSLKYLPEDDNESLFRGSWDEVYNGVVLLPPPGQACFVEIYGDFYSPYLSSNGDVNYWTLNHPILLANAANVFIEGGMRNSQGVQDFLSLLQVCIRGINSQAILQAVQDAGTQRKG